MREKLFKWTPSLIIMLVIFVFSSQPSDSLPNFDWADRLIKKSGHVFEYGILTLSYWYGFAWAKNRRWLAWALAVLYACTDEFHQSFTPGRFPSVWDVLIFDNLGALISLWLASVYLKQKRPEKNT